MIEMTDTEVVIKAILSTGGNTGVEVEAIVLIEGDTGVTAELDVKAGAEVEKDIQMGNIPDVAVVVIVEVPVATEVDMKTAAVIIDN